MVLQGNVSSARAYKHIPTCVALKTIRVALRMYAYLKSGSKAI